MTDSTVSTGSAFHSPAKFTSAFSSSSSAVTVTAFDARFSPPPASSHADPFINATSPAPPSLVSLPSANQFGGNLSAMESQHRATKQPMASVEMSDARCGANGMNLKSESPIHPNTNAQNMKPSPMFLSLCRLAVKMWF